MRMNICWVGEATTFIGKHKETTTTFSLLLLFVICLLYIGGAGDPRHYWAGGHEV